VERLPSPSEILRQHQLRAKHSWGQNFLRDESALERIVEAIAPVAGEPVVELGAGLGHLTSALLNAGAQVTAVERDRDLVRLLEQWHHPRLRVVAANAATLDFAKAAGAPRVAVVGNLPFHLTSEILFQVLAQRASISRAVFTIQKEVAQRLAAPPGGRDYGILSVRLGLHYQLENVLPLPAAFFYPPPKVDAALVRLTPLPKPRARIASEDSFQRLVKAAFGQRRKTLLNSLKAGGAGSPAELEQALAQAGINGTRRAETLSVEEFAALDLALAKDSRA
jgi:16S rRNA (adenine1518-N6/adenine1519-N6)-dimethyltransferase